MSQSNESSPNDNDEHKKPDQPQGPDPRGASSTEDRTGEENEQREAGPDGASIDADRSSGAEPAEDPARLREAMLRLRAEMDNQEKRMEREMTKARKFALEAVMRDFLPVLDSLDQALTSSESEEAGTASEGLVLTRKLALKALSEHGLEMLEPVGERFDPSWHEAMATQPSDDHEPDTIVNVLQKGYRLHDRLLRPARVIVAKAG